MASFPNPDDLANLNPQTTREWLQFINTKLDAMMEGQTEISETLVEYIDKTEEWIKAHDAGLLQREKLSAQNCEKIDQLEKKATTWSLTNSIVAIGAFISALLMKGS
jgi:hypothetical protein